MNLETIRQNYTFFSDGLYETYLNIYKQFAMFNWDRKKKLNLDDEKNKWRSNVVIGVIQKATAVMYAGIFDNALSYKVSPTLWYWLSNEQTREEQGSADKIKQLL